MNKSNYLSNQVKQILDQNSSIGFSSTSSEFMTEINRNVKNIMKGGNMVVKSKTNSNNNCNCQEAFDNFKNLKLDKALYTILNNNCCYKCKDHNGNTILHNLVLSCNDDKCIQVIEHVISDSNIASFINIQNHDGRTAMLLAAMNANKIIAHKLNLAGADKSIADNNGNYIETESTASDTNDAKNIIESPAKNNIAALLKTIVNNSDNNYDDLTSLNLNSVVTYPITVVDNADNIDNTDVWMSKLKESKLKSNEILDSNIEANSDTEKVIGLIGQKYEGLLKKSQSNQIKSMLDKFIETETETFDPNVEYNTSDLIDKINQVEPNKNIFNNNLSGGASRQIHKQKLSGFRNMMRDSDQNPVSKIDYDLMFTSDGNNEFGSGSNELSRMMQNQRDKAHEEVYNTILSMLSKKIILQNSKPLEANEDNAKAIKAYLYRIINEKNPQLGGLDKILVLKKMSEQQIIEMVNDMPDLDELKANIQKQIQERIESRKNNNDDNKTSKKVSTKNKQSNNDKKSKDNDKKAKDTGNDKKSKEINTEEKKTKSKKTKSKKTDTESE